MRLHEHHARSESVEGADPLAMERVAHARLQHYWPVALIVFGLVIVTPAWIGLLVWLAFTVGAWAYESACVCMAFLVEFLQTT